MVQNYIGDFRYYNSGEQMGLFLSKLQGNP